MGKEKKEENYIKVGEKGLINASFWAINSKNLSGKKIKSEKRGGGLIRIHNIYPCFYIITCIFTILDHGMYEFLPTQMRSALCGLWVAVVENNYGDMKR